MAAEGEQPTGLPVMFQQGPARPAMPPFCVALGPSDDGRIQFVLK
jgi:hypothetical protein